MKKTKFTPPQIAAKYGISSEKVHAWIYSGELVAIDGATRRGDRPRFLVDIADLEAFEASRKVVPPQPRARRKTRKLHDEIVRHFRTTEDKGDRDDGPQNTA